MTTPGLIGNRYEVGELIGYGGMAEVHRGRDMRLGREVAIKILRADLARDQTFLNRFRREAQSAAGLNHPSIVAVYDTGEDGYVDAPIPYIVMEYVQGRTLRDVLRAEGRLPVQRAMEVVADICGALDYSHRMGIVHRDIKPGNVMITTTGAVKVMDFGIARALSNDAATVTQTAAVIGTAQYLSPEQARGEPVDARSDVYSVGCLLFELVTGHPPFQGDSPVAVAYQHVRETPALPSATNPEVSRALDSIVMKALAKNPLNRYQSAGEMRSDLLRALAARPVEAETALTDAEKTQLISRMAPGPIPGLPSRHQSDADLDLEEEDSGRRGALIWVSVLVALLLVIGGGAWAYVALGKSDSPKTYSLPSLVGQTQSNALAKLHDEGFTNIADVKDSTGPCRTDPAADPITVPEGNICTQDPAPGDKIPLKGLITLTVYKIPMATVQNYKGMSWDDASAAITAANLVPVKQNVASTEPAGTVIGQSPPAFGDPVPEGTKITLKVSTGKAPTAPVGNYSGMSWDDASAAITAAKLNPVRQNVDSFEPAGQVLSQSPVYGSDPVPEGSDITLKVSTGTKKLPDVTGKTRDDAMGILLPQGWSNIQTPSIVPTSDPALNNIVASMSPPPGTRYTQDTPIVLTIYSYQPPTTPTTSHAATPTDTAAG
ncbi:MAG: Stk1 family PASTA domain-containing Ser/Thr kinase [Actinomycetia bacterium]|nr:Stk1 family PASTA domain-containing Ser/Thr kinase [Actinomycetes bacterium]